MNSEEMYEYLDKLVEAKVDACVNKLFIKDYMRGYDTAREDIKTYARNKYECKSDIQEGYEWCSGYRSAIIDITEYIERM